MANANPRIDHAAPQPQQSSGDGSSVKEVILRHLIDEILPDEDGVVDAARRLVAYWDSLDAVATDDSRPTEEFAAEMDRRTNDLRDKLQRASSPPEEAAAVGNFKELVDAFRRAAGGHGEYRVSPMIDPAYLRDLTAGVKVLQNQILDAYSAALARIAQLESQAVLMRKALGWASANA